MNQKLKQIIINANLGDGEYLGHKIGLIEVLTAISNKYTTTEKGIFVDAFGRFWDIKKISKTRIRMDIVARWELNKDLNWHIENKPETIKFLENILLNER